MYIKSVILLLWIGLIFSAKADTPANCMIEDIYGKWDFFIGKPRDGVDCNKHCIDNAEVQWTIELKAPNNAAVLAPHNGEFGWWTMIYNQGFEITAGTHTFFAFFWFKEQDYNCAKTMPGWFSTWAGNERRCFVAIKQASNENLLEKTHAKKTTRESNPNNFDSHFNVDHGLVEKINNIPGLSWTAGVYENLWNTSMTIRQAKKYQGQFVKETSESKFFFNKDFQDSIPENVVQDQYKSERLSNPPKPFQNTREGPIADAWDWRDVDGENYVSPVRHQDSCGSCYAFASAAEIEARIRIATENNKQPVLSPQQVVDCSPYSQGCEGGFPYLIAGKWAHDWGFVDETCYPYEGKDASCRDPGLKKFVEDDDVDFHDKDDCSTRYYSWMYRYVGWFYGNCDAESMKEEIYRHGPVAVGFEVLDDFRYYKNGIYRHTGLRSEVNEIYPSGVKKVFEVTNHAVLVVGYGHCHKEGLDYWVVKNSWGDKWGMDGYFKIVRGQDEVGIESMAQASYVVQPI